MRRPASSSSSRPEPLSPRRPPEAAAFEQEYPGASWLASRCVRELEVVGGFAEAAISSVARRFDLSHAALNALAVIEGAGEPVPSGEVGARMHITSGTVTALLDNLERKGYVQRLVDSGDRRRVMVDVTPKAQAVLDEMLPAVQQMSRQLVDRLGPQGQQALIDALAEVRAAVADLPDDLPPPQPRNRPQRLDR